MYRDTALSSQKKGFPKLSEFQFEFGKCIDLEWWGVVNCMEGMIEGSIFQDTN
jgi:hypothetical protein